MYLLKYIKMSSGTFSQIYIHLIFAVRGRESAISSVWEESLYKYITGIVQNKGHKMLAINGMPDHIHILIGFKPSGCLSDLVREIKKSSNTFVNENYTRARFQWQAGYGAFSYSHSALDKVISYIINQKAHHTVKTFKEEYVGLLKKFEVSYDDQFLFEWN